MVMCWAPDCKHYSGKETCKFFKFPTNIKLRRKWMKLVRRKEKPGPYTRLCSCHFEEESKENLPTLFTHNLHKRFRFSSPERRTRASAKSTVSSESAIPLESAIPSESAIPVEEFVSETANLNKESVTEAANPDEELVSESVERDLPEPTEKSIAEPPTSVALLEIENYYLKQRIAVLESGFLKPTFGFKVIEKDNTLCKLFTGLPTPSIFIALYELLENIPINYYLGWNVEKIPKIDQLLMCLMKLRQNYPHKDLAQRFGVSQGTISNIVITWIGVLHEILVKQLNSTIPSRRKNQSCLPTAFNTFTNCRIVLDCTEMAMTVPRASMSTQKATYSNYKHKNTWKALVGVAPNGVITYVSTLYPGSSSDKKIVQDCGILENFKPGDLILADKGFLIKDMLPSGVSLNIPPFLQTAQFTPTQVKQTEKIAKARIHVERAIRRMKSFKILNFIPRSLFEQAGSIVQVVGALTNLQRPLLDEVKDDFSSESE